MVKRSFKARVVHAVSEEIHKGWVRTSKERRGGIPNGSYVKLSANQRTIYCQVLGTPKETDTDLVRMSEWYRNALGWDELPSEKVDFEITPVGLSGKLKALFMHPDDVVRAGVGLALISVGLGMLGVGIALLPQAIRVATGSDEISAVFGWLSLAVVVPCISLAVILIAGGIVALIGSSPKTPKSFEG